MIIPPNGLQSSLMAKRELIGKFVSRNLKIRYKNSVLGFFWSLLTPLCSILMYAIFAKLLKFGGDGYLPYLITGIIAWQFTVSCLNDSLHAIVGNSNLVKKVFFPRIILPLSTALANAINFFLTFIVLVLYLVVSGSADFTDIWLILPAFAMQMVLCLGIACFCSTSNVFFRDTEHIIGVVSQAWFFLTPIMYPMSFQTDVITNKFTDSLLPWIYLNPMTGILTLYRKALLGAKANLGDELPAAVDGWMPICLSFAACLLVLFLGRTVLRVGDRKFGDVL